MGGWAGCETLPVAAGCVPGAVAAVRVPGAVGADVEMAGKAACVALAAGCCGCLPVVLVRATAAATDTATSPPLTNTHARRRLRPRHGGWPVPPGWGCAAAAYGVLAGAAVTVEGPPGASGGGVGLGTAPNSVTGRADGPSAAAATVGVCVGNPWVIARQPSLRRVRGV